MALRAIADALGQAVGNVNVSELQVSPRLLVNPTPPAVDIYPADPSQEDAAFGSFSSLTLWTVRARVTTVDHDANQDLLLDLLEPYGSTSVRAALLTDKTLGGLAEGMDVDRPTGMTVYPALEGTASYLGCEWRVRIYTNGGPVG